MMPPKIWALLEPHHRLSGFWRNKPHATFSKPPVQATPYVRADIVNGLVAALRGLLARHDRTPLADHDEIVAARAALAALEDKP